MSALLDDLDALLRPPPKQCAVAGWLDQLDPEVQAKVDAAFGLGISRAQIHDVLKAHGFTWSLSAFNNHLSRRCSCPSSESDTE